MPINSYDLRDGFAENYHSLQLSDDNTGTTWTHRILGYFDQLGRMLGYFVQLEKEKYDLTWWDYSIDQEDGKLILHVESENNTAKKRIIEQTLENKILTSHAKIVLAICYPNNEEDFKEISNWIQNNIQNEMYAEEAVIMLDGVSCKKKEPYRFDIYIIRKDKKELYLYEKTVVNENYCLEYKDEKLFNN